MENLENISYEVIETSEDPGEAKLLKRGISAEFTLNDIDRDMKLVGKKRAELVAQLDIEDAKMENIKRTNPEIAEMDENMRKCIYIYQTAFSFSKVANEKIAEMDALLKEYREEFMQIMIQTGLGRTTPADENSKPGE